ARPALHDVREREIGHHRARRAELIRIVEMVDVGRVEVDGLLDPAQAELAGEEIIVLARIFRHRGDVMQAFDLVEHFKLLCSGAASSPRSMGSMSSIGTFTTSGSYQQ